MVLIEKQEETTVFSCLDFEKLTRAPPLFLVTRMPPSKKNGKRYTLIPGKLYDFTIINYDIKTSRYGYFTYTGTFKKNWYDYTYRQHCIFDLPDSPHRMTVACNSMKVKPSLSPIVAKQVARGLSEYIPEDCAGIIERMLVGDRIVGQGPDRYPERTV